MTMISDKDITAIRNNIHRNREAVWKAILPLLPTQDPSAKLLREYLSELKAFKKRPKQSRSRDGSMRAFRPSVGTRSKRPCKVCGATKPAPHDKPAHNLFLRKWRYKLWLTNWWKDKSPEERKARTHAANEARRNITNRRLLLTVPDRLRTLLGDRECIRRLRGNIPLGLS